ncbi:MAG: GGDEF domain-containing protein [Chloroflexi bacterium]|nr:GGDEF domain-containing protein [Chloroflexota bacterium]
MLDVRLETQKAVRQSLEKRGVAPADQEFLLNLLDLLISNISEAVDQENMVTITREISRNLLSNHQLLILLRQQAAELDALKKLSLHLTSSLDLKTVLDAVVSNAMHLPKNARTAHIFLYDADNDKLEFGAALDEEGNRNKIWAEPRPDGLTYNVARGGKTIIVEDMQKHPLYKNAPKSWTGSIVGIPLKTDENVVGVMNLSSSSVGEFAESDMRLLQLLADQAAIAISNARLHETVSQQAHSDTLTGLPNRRALDEHLENEVRTARRTGYTFATVMMDLDGFKSINDTYGHTVGDQVLRVLFNYLAQGLRTSDFLARYGGDELTLILSQTDMLSAKVVTDKLLEKLHRFSFDLPDGAQLKVSMSGGIAIYPIHGQTASQLLRSADEALYRAKKHRRGAFLIAKAPTGKLTLSPKQ